MTAPLHERAADEEGIGMDVVAHTYATRYRARVAHRLGDAWTVRGSLAFIDFYALKHGLRILSIRPEPGRRANQGRRSSWLLSR